MGGGWGCCPSRPTRRSALGLLLRHEAGVGRTLRYLDVHELLDAAAPDLEGDRLPGLGGADRVDRLGVGRDVLAVDSLDHVTRLKPGRVGRRPLDDLDDRDALALVVELHFEVGRDRRERCSDVPDVGPLVDARALLERNDLLFDRVGRYREADALGAGLWARRRLVHADETPVDVDQRTAGVAGVDRR